MEEKFEKAEKRSGSDSEKKILTAPSMESKKISFLDALFTMLCATFGAGVIILPYTVMQMGLIGAVLGFLFFLIIKVTAAVISARSCEEMMSSIDSSVHIRDPLYRLACMASGPVLGRVSLFLLAVSQVVNGLSYEVLISQTLSGLLPIYGISTPNQIRVYLCAVAAVIIPLSFLGYLKENKWTVLFGVISSLLTLLCIVVVSFIAYFSFDLPDTPMPEVTFESFVSGSGKIFFAFAGPVILSPNVSVEINDVGSMEKLIISCFLILGFLYSMAIFVPSLVFRGLTEDNILLSLKHVDSKLATVLSLIAQISMLLHIVAACVLNLNIIIQPIEEYLNVPIEWTWKRGVVRGGLIVTITLMGIILPSASILISLAGGISVILLTVGLPAFVYYKLFHIGWGMKTILLLLLTVALFEAASSLYSGARSIINFYS